MNKPTLIIGASPKPDRYANKAQKALSHTGHTVVPYNPRGGEIEGIKVFDNLEHIEQELHTITLYVRPQILEKLIDTLVKLKPARVIFNPGTEDQTFQQKFEQAGIIALEACTLVLLQTKQY